MPRKSATPKRPRKTETAGLVHQFLVVLSNVDPLIWRRIQVPESYSFWDLHVAIQDAMGWLDTHLHEFIVVDGRTRVAISLGIPDDEFPDVPPRLPGWDVGLADLDLVYGPPMRYLYDFGDSWEHAIIDEGISEVEPGVVYPRCVAGARACPPEDCGGTQGFVEFLSVIADADHEEHDAMLTWAGGSYDAAAFDPTAVHFDNPRERWKGAFQ